MTTGMPDMSLAAMAWACVKFGASLWGMWKLSRRLSALERRNNGRGE